MDKQGKSDTVLQVNLHTLATFVGVIFLLLGVYTAIRVAANLKMYEKYPTVGVLNLNIFGTYTIAPQRDEDCSYITPYYGPDGTLRAATADEKTNELMQKENCLKGVTATREATKTNDINTAIFLLFMGAGLFALRKFVGTR